MGFFWSPTRTVHGQFHNAHFTNSRIEASTDYGQFWIWKDEVQRTGRTSNGSSCLWAFWGMGLGVIPWDCGQHGRGLDSCRRVNQRQAVISFADLLINAGASEIAALHSLSITLNNGFDALAIFVANTPRP